MIKAIVAFFLLLLFINNTGCAQTEALHKNLYVNHTYGYHVSIPQGLIAVRNQSPLPDHGFRITLSTVSQAFLWVDGSYNALEWTNLDEAVKTHQDWLTKESKDLTEISRNYISLDQIKAVRVVSRYKNATTNELMVQDIVLAIRDRPEGTGIIYTIGLKTPDSRYTNDRETIDGIIKSWRLLSLPQ